MDAVPSLLVPRASWRNSSEYPDIDYDDRDGWAWEFLRRSARYATSYAEHQSVTSQSGGPSSKDEFCLQWHVSEPTDPVVCWRDTSRPKISEIAPAIFLAPSTPAQDGECYAVTLSSDVPMTSRHALIRIDLDQNIKEQLKKAGSLLGAPRMTPTYELGKDGRPIITLVPPKSEFRIILDQLHFVLRTLDAVADTGMRADADIFEPWPTSLVHEIVRTFQHESDGGRFSDGRVFRTDAVRGWMQTAYRCAMARGYIQIATEQTTI